MDGVAAPTADLDAQVYQALVANRTEPWGQTVSRLLGPEGLQVGIAHTPTLPGGTEGEDGDEDDT